FGDDVDQAISARVPLAAGSADAREKHGRSRIRPSFSQPEMICNVISSLQMISRIVLGLCMAMAQNYLRRVFAGFFGPSSFSDFSPISARLGFGLVSTRIPSSS